MEQAGSRQWRDSATVLAALVGGTFLRFLNLGDRPLWLDEIIQLKRFSGPSLLNNILALEREIAAVPLDYIVQSLFVSLGGTSEFAVRFHAALFGALSLPLVYLVGKHLFEKRVATIALVLFAVYPLHYQYSREGRNYALFVFMTLAGFYLLLRACTGGGRLRWAGFSLVTALNLYTNYFAGLVLVAQAGWYLSLRFRPVLESWRVPRGSSPPTWISFGLSAAVAAAAFVPWIYFTIHSAQADAPGVFSDLWSETGLPMRTLREISGGSYPLSLVMLLFWAAGLKRMIAERSWAHLSLMICWGILPLLMVLGFVWWRQYIFSIRQILFATPALLLMSAYGIDGLCRLPDRLRSNRRLVVLVLLVVGLALGKIAFERKNLDEDWRGLAGYLGEASRREERVVAPGIDFVLSWYLPQLPDRMLSLSEAEPFLAAGSTSATDDGLLLVESRFMSEDQQSGSRKLRENSQTVNRSLFRGFVVYHLEAGSQSPARE